MKRFTNLLLNFTFILTFLSSPLLAQAEWGGGPSQGGEQPQNPGTPSEVLSLLDPASPRFNPAYTALVFARAQENAATEALKQPMDVKRGPVLITGLGTKGEQLVFPILPFDNQKLTPEFVMEYVTQLEYVSYVLGSDAVTYMIHEYAKRGLSLPKMRDVIAQMTGDSDKPLTVFHQVHPNALKYNIKLPVMDSTQSWYSWKRYAPKLREVTNELKVNTVQKTNADFMAVGLPIVWVPVENSKLPDPSESKSKSAWGEICITMARYGLGVGMAIAGWHISGGNVAVPVLIGGLLAPVILEAQFANRKMNNYFWTPFFQKTGILGVEAVNIGYGLAIYATQAGVWKALSKAGLISSSFDSLKIGNFESAAVNSVVMGTIFTFFAYGRWQLNKVHQFSVGAITNDQRYRGEFKFLVPANAFRIAAYMFPSLIFFQIQNALGFEGVTLQFGPAQVGLLALGVVMMIPDYVKTFLGPVFMNDHSRLLMSPESELPNTNPRLKQAVEALSKRAQQVLTTLSSKRPPEEKLAEVDALGKEAKTGLRSHLTDKFYEVATFVRNTPAYIGCLPLLNRVANYKMFSKPVSQDALSIR